LTALPQSLLILELLNLFFLLFHTGLSLFNVFGWIFRKTRLYNLICLLLTGFSWFVMGIWYGWGYCICTDWHWQVRSALGDTDLPASYITFLIQHWTGFNPDPYWVDLATGTVFGLALIVSVYLNYRDFRDSTEEV
jgi:hypothetical protein